LIARLIPPRSCEKQTQQRGNGHNSFLVARWRLAGRSRSVSRPPAAAAVDATRSARRRCYYGRAPKPMLLLLLVVVLLYSKCGD